MRYRITHFYHLCQGIPPSGPSPGLRQSATNPTKLAVVSYHSRDVFCDHPDSARVFRVGMADFANLGPARFEFWYPKDQRRLIRKLDAILGAACILYSIQAIDIQIAIMTGETNAPACQNYTFPGFYFPFPFSLCSVMSCHVMPLARTSLQPNTEFNVLLTKYLI